nr:RIB43A-like with coiled-coils protein 2 [Parasteatoda tepidariorum]
MSFSQSNNMALNLPLDEKLTASINRRRIVEEQRKQRIFNSKVRQIGIDVEALNWQVHDSKFQRAKEEERDRKFAEEAINNDKLALLFEQQKNDQVREVNKKMDEYRLTAQRPEFRRDFDLYDPDGKKKELPPRISDNDLCPISGLQKLDGEDLNNKNRSKKQKQQIRDLLLQQMHEKRLENYKKDREIQEWEKALLDQDRKAMLLEKMQEENYKKMIESLKRDNKLMSLQTLERKMSDKIMDDIEKKKDIEFNFYESLLNEDLSSARSSLGSHRVPGDRWKGMNKGELQEIYKEQLRQIEEKKRRREAGELENAVWDQQLMNLEKEALRLKEEEKRIKHLMNENLQSINHELSREQKFHNDYMNKVAFKNTISKDFFSQFNTTTR